MTKLKFISKRKTTTRLKSHIHKLRQALRRNPDHFFFHKCDHRHNWIRPVLGIRVSWEDIHRGKCYFSGLIKIVLQAILILSNNLHVRNFLLF